MIIRITRKAAGQIMDRTAKRATTADSIIHHCAHSAFKSSTLRARMVVLSIPESCDHRLLFLAKELADKRLIHWSDLDAATPPNPDKRDSAESPEP